MVSVRDLTSTDLPSASIATVWNGKTVAGTLKIGWYTVATVWNGINYCRRIPRTFPFTAVYFPGMVYGDNPWKKQDGNIDPDFEIPGHSSLACSVRAGGGGNLLAGEKERKEG